MQQRTEPSAALPTTTESESDAAEAMAVAALDLARHFARGATLWCAAPRWPEHARHVAVEFVHPVIVGKRALPAISIESPDLVASLRAQVRSGDVLLLLSEGDDAIGRDVLRRARAWGVTSVWLGVGDQPPQALADHAIWTTSPGGRSGAPHDGQLVLRYHVLWELTHVCFEHPGLLELDQDVALCDDEVCITCGDEGVLGEVLDADADDSVRVRTARGVEVVNASIVAPVAPGDIVLVHGGAAIAAIP